MSISGMSLRAFKQYFFVPFDRPMEITTVLVTKGRKVSPAPGNVSLTSRKLIVRAECLKDSVVPLLGLQFFENTIGLHQSTWQTRSRCFISIGVLSLACGPIRPHAVRVLASIAVRQNKVSAIANSGLSILIPHLRNIDLGDSATDRSDAVSIRHICAPQDSRRDQCKMYLIPAMDHGARIVAPLTADTMSCGQ